MASSTLGRFPQVLVAVSMHGLGRQEALRVGWVFHEGEAWFTHRGRDKVCEEQPAEDSMDTAGVSGGVLGPGPHVVFLT